MSKENTTPTTDNAYQIIIYTSEDQCLYLDNRRIRYISQIDLGSKKISFTFPSSAKTDEEAIAGLKKAGFFVEINTLSDS